jgi:hypothetical protein
MQNKITKKKTNSNKISSEIDIEKEKFEIPVFLVSANRGKQLEINATIKKKANKEKKKQ